MLRYGWKAKLQCQIRPNPTEKMKNKPKNKTYYFFFNREG